MSDMLDMLTLDDLDGSSRDLAEVIGMDAFRRLVRTYGGSCIPYVPKAENLTTPIRDRVIVEEFNGYNYQELARKYGMSERWIREITRIKAEKMRTEPVPGQLSLSDLVDQD